MNENAHVLIIGGGLAGLTSAIHLAKEGVPVTLVEKEIYPKHKVCGEYISNEVLPYFDFLSINLETIQPVNISKFTISTQIGTTIESKLPLGGFGVSRYTLDHYLWKKAKEAGVNLINDQVVDVTYDNDIFNVSISQNQILQCKYVIGAYGKRTALDKAIGRDFILKKSPWLAVKGHYKANIDSNTVALHNFKGGYCGLSKVENNTVNACYLVNYKSFQNYKDINAFQNEILCQNQHLNDFFRNAELLFDTPITISQVSFDKKKPVEHHVFMIGDAAGLIHPLCGNGMAMAIQSAQILSKILIADYTSNTVASRAKLEKQYTKQWNLAFAKRLYVGRVLQKVLLNSKLQKISYHAARILPAIVPKIIKQTHGQPLVC